MSDEKLSLTNALMTNVRGIQPTGGHGVCAGPYLTSEEHKDLVLKKYEIGQNIDDHITLFRKQDKKGLGHAEIRAHTVPGPWTPSSSLGFVLGGLNQGLRIWLGTQLDSNNFFNDQLRPAILARELALVIQSGWIARAPYTDECYEESSAYPITVFTPPGSPTANVNATQRLMDVNVDDLSTSMKNLISSSYPQESKLAGSAGEDFAGESDDGPFQRSGWFLKEDFAGESDDDFQGSGWFLNGVEAAAGSVEEYEARGLAYDYDHAFCSTDGDEYGSDDEYGCSFEHPCMDPHGW